ncbi:MAG: ABC transporter ATP-binding protein [Phycisphaerales bacterium JB063]
MIELTDVQFRYAGSDSAGFTLEIEKLTLPAGSRTAIVGPSGSGKTTLLHLIAGILTPGQAGRGSVRVDGRNLADLADADRRRFRRTTLGMVFQTIELLDYLDVRGNLELPYRLGAGLTLDRAAREHIDTIAKRVGLGDKLSRLPGHLSQGERQRVAICRALAGRPKLLLADEPTSALDEATTAATIDLLFELAREQGTTLIVLTHDRSLLPRFDQVVHVEAGRVTRPMATEAV